MCDLNHTGDCQRGWDAGYEAGTVGLEKVWETATHLERERIIKLLKDNAGWLDEQGNLSTLTAIELIKGENK